MGLTKIQIRPMVYLTSFKRLLKEVNGVLFLNKWVQKEKENIVPVDDTMLPDILRIQEEGFENTSKRELIKYSKRFRNVFYVIKNQDKVVGYCIYYIKPVLSLKGLKKKSIIFSIAIDSNFRRKGFGEKLLKETIEEMKLNKISSVLLYVTIDNFPAIKLYEKIGFKIKREIENICGYEEKCYEMELKLT